MRRIILGWLCRKHEVEGMVVSVIFNIPAYSSLVVTLELKKGYTFTPLYIGGYSTLDPKTFAELAVLMQIVDMDRKIALFQLDDFPDTHFTIEMYYPEFLNFPNRWDLFINYNETRSATICWHKVGLVGKIENMDKFFEELNEYEEIGNFGKIIRKLTGLPVRAMEILKYKK